MSENHIKLKKISDYLWEIPQEGGMKVPGRIYASSKILKEIEKDESLKQVANVAFLPGIVGYSLAMPDIHWGYGFPIGGVAATTLDEGVISPGGVGYDINCGVRLLRTDLETDYVKKNIKKIISALYSSVPTGVGSHGAIPRLSLSEERQLLEEGVNWAGSRGFGDPADILHIEEKGQLAGADSSRVSSRALERGLKQVGTLGSGNHFLEIDEIVEVYDEKAAEKMGLKKGGITITIHTGSRGLGYQVCDDYLKRIIRAMPEYGLKLPDRQLACVPVDSKEGRDYFSAMKCAANYAWVNRQVIMHLTIDAIEKALNISPDRHGIRLVYDVCHNIAKFEVHIIQGKKVKLCVHRKGATRAFPPGHPDIPEDYKEIGQPVLVPGDMGRNSFVCVGSEGAMKFTFGSTCHGAGRIMSRRASFRESKGRDLYKEIERMGVFAMSTGRGTMAEEMPYAYKNVNEVVDVMHKAGISKKVVKLKPIGVIKG
ncbi:MAG: RtcB family protein [Fidelibacterota bacterium]